MHNKKFIIEEKFTNNYVKVHDEYAITNGSQLLRVIINNIDRILFMKEQKTES